MMWTVVGLLKHTWTKYVVAALAVILISFGMIQYIQEDAREELIKDIQIEQAQDNEDTRDRINNAIDEVNRATPNADAALEWLLRRQE